MFAWMESVEFVVPTPVHLNIHFVIGYLIEMCSLCLNQELSTIEGKPRMVFHHPGKGNAAAASEETSILEKLPKFDFPGESLNRRRYLINPLTSLGLVDADCLLYSTRILFFNLLI